MNGNEHPYLHYYDMLYPALKSKVEEFEVLGYKDATISSLWTYLLKKKWKKTNGHPRLFQLVSDILSVKPGEYMNFETVEAFRSPNWFTDLDEEELNDLFRSNKDRK
ncbi:post-transcriptional regulator [Rossellomorea sp. BNER]|jgi:hypothetical protein|uniref:post-transcriptional regulator n=1 Tax=Rossellomorea sp. BNER TaxID=2962031 RepID=UPI003AF1F52E|nr:post-transcriptional regulator [Rossellomorea sp. BNER]